MDANHRKRSFVSVTFGFGAMVATALAFAACSTPTTITDAWQDPSYSAGPMKNLLVFGGRMNQTNRRTLEDGFVSALSAHGVHATASYVLFPGDVPNKEQARTAAQQAGVDGVLVAVMRGAHDRATIVPGAYPDGFWGYYGGYGSGWAGDTGQVVVDTFVKFETSLWDSRGDGKMVWSAVTQTENPSSGPDFVRSLTKDVIPAMTKAGFLPVAAVSYRYPSAARPVL